MIFINQTQALMALISMGVCLLIGYIAIMCYKIKRDILNDSEDWWI